MLEQGLEYEIPMLVTPESTAEYIGSGDMAVFATPAMIALMGNASMLCAAPHLQQGETTVGASMSTSHVAPSAVGATVRAHVKLTAVEGRKLTFRVEAFDGDKLIGEGEHVRYVVDREKFLAKLAKRQ